MKNFIGGILRLTLTIAILPALVGCGTSGRIKDFDELPKRLGDRVSVFVNLTPDDPTVPVLIPEDYTYVYYLEKNDKIIAAYSTISILCPEKAVIYGTVFKLDSADKSENPTFSDRAFYQIKIDSAVCAN